MARWIFECKKCGFSIHRSTIPDTLENFYYPTRPSISEEGVCVECPDCGTKAVYKREHLRYAS
jgi:predicted RNA-binding Zn-ribbon protein involved in translation (DUF1610 family)